MLVGERRDLLMARLRRDGKLVARDIAHEFSLSEESVRRDFESWLPPGFANGSMGEPSHCRRPRAISRRGLRWRRRASVGSPNAPPS